MKVQFAADGLRVRVVRDELVRLLGGEPLTLAIGPAWRIEVVAAAGFAIGGGPHVLSVAVPRVELHGLAARLPARDGIEGTVEAAGRPLRVAFEVDLLDGRARRPR